MAVLRDRPETLAKHVPPCARADADVTLTLATCQSPPPAPSPQPPACHLGLTNTLANTVRLVGLLRVQSAGDGLPVRAVTRWMMSSRR